MSVNPIQSWVSANNPLFLLANVSTLVAGNIQANNISTGNLTVSSISGNPTIASANIQSSFISSLRSSELSSIFIEGSEATISTLFTQHIILDQATLDVQNGNELLLNGIPIATTNLLSNLADWAAYPAICTLKMSGSNIENAGTIYSQNIINSLNVQSDTFTTLTNLTSPLATISQLRTTGLSTNTFQVNTINNGLSNININSFVNLSNFTCPLGTISSLTSSNIRSLGISTNNLSTGTINTLPYISGSNWSAYPATQTVQLAGNNMNTSGNLTLTVASNYFINTQETAITADGGINIASITDLTLNALNGNRGQINIQADPGFNNGVAGVVNITANGGQVGGVGTGGTINLTANTPVGYCNLTSKVSINASGVNSYAGSIPAVASLYGYNFIYGQNGVNICSGLPPAFPNIPFTTYLYGTAGVTTSSDFYCPSIYPYWNGLTNPPDLTITGRYIIPNAYQVYLQLSNVKYLYMDSFAQIQNAQLINMNNGTISNANTIQGTGTISGYTTISATNVGFTTATGTTVNTSNINSSNIINSNTIQTSNLVVNQIGNISTLNASSIYSPIWGNEFRIINQLPGSLSGGSGSNSVARLIAEKPSGISTVAQIVAADTGMTIASFTKQNNLTSLFLNASTIRQSTNNTFIQTERQPFIQRGYFLGTGGSGSQVIDLPLGYYDSTYLVFASMMDASPAQMSGVANTSNQITIYWGNAGGGSQTIGWMTIGDLTEYCPS